MPDHGERLMRWSKAFVGKQVSNLPAAQIRALHAQWPELVHHKNWTRIPSVVRAECLILATQVALLAGDVPAAQESWRAAVAARPDNFGLRATLAEVQALSSAAPEAERIALARRLHDAMVRTPLARPDANVPGIVFGSRLDRI